MLDLIIVAQSYVYFEKLILQVTIKAIAFGLEIEQI